MKKLLKIEVCGTCKQCTGALFTGELLKVAATVHEQCMNSNCNGSSPTETRLEKKKKKKLNSKRVSKPCLRRKYMMFQELHLNI